MKKYAKLILFYLLGLIIFFCAALAKAQTVETLPIASPLCAGETFQTSYTANGEFDEGNVFTAQLSDALGDFSDPVNIGSVESVISGDITSVLPKDLPEGFAYRVRVVASDPETVGSDNGEDLTIFEAPSFNIIGSDSSCSGDTYEYSDSGEPITFTFNWSAQGGEIVSDSSMPNVNVRWTGTGTGILRLVKKNKSTGCVDTANVEITLITPPEATIASGDYNVCEGEIIEYLAEPGETSLVDWNVQGGVILESDIAYAEVLWNSPGEGTIELRKTGAFGCVGVDTKTVVITPKPNAIITGPNSVVSGDTNVYHTDYADSLYYLWRVEGGALLGDSTLDSAAIEWQEVENATITLIQTNRHTGCADTATREIDVYIPPELGEIAGDFSVCQGDVVEYSTEEISDIAIKWKAEGGEIIGADNNFTVQVNWLAAGGYSIKYVVTDFSVSYKDSVLKDVNVREAPQVTLRDFSDVCESDSSFPLTGGMPQGGEYFGEGVENNRFYPSDAGIGTHLITYSYTDEFGCSNSATKDLEVLPAPPKPVISREGDTLFSSAETGNQWYKNGEEILGANNKYYVPEADGLYSVKVTGNNGCESEMSEPYDFSTAVEEQRTLKIKIYPNPASNYLIIEAPLTLVTKITLTNLVGEAIIEKTINNRQDEKIKLSLSSLSPGVYFYRLQINGKIESGKLIKTE